MTIWKVIFGVLLTLIVTSIVTKGLQQWLTDWPLIWIHLPVLMVVLIGWMLYLVRVGALKKNSENRSAILKHQLLRMATLSIFGVITMALYYKPDSVGDFLLIAMAISILLLGGSVIGRYNSKSKATRNDPALVDE